MVLPGVNYWKKHWKTLTVVAVLIVSLPLTVPLAQKAWEWVTGASFQPATLVVDTANTRGQMRPIWQGLAQGFEKAEGADFRLKEAAGFLKAEGVKYVRIDHIYDGYGVVSRGGDGSLRYDWTKLDAMVGDIVSAGALPYFSLSYMPDVISNSDILDYPKNWGEWGAVVAATVGHYSRDYRGGLADVIYEVWNEPDLFGSWKMGGVKNYTTLYSTAAKAAVSVRGTKAYKIGGPATTGFYPTWVAGFYDKLDSDVRIDFFSWHRYSAKVEDFVRDADQAKKLIAPKISRAQDIYISEWGVNPERGSQYDGRWAGAHYLAVNRALEDSVVDLAMTFEVMDGVSGDQQFHGGWGMLTNPKYGPVVQKPRAKAMTMLTKMVGVRLPVTGEGTYVTALAAKSPDGAMRVLAVNYDPSGQHDELFPLSYVNLDDGTYTVKEEYLSGRSLTVEVGVTGGILRRDISLSPSDAVLLTVAKK